METAGKPVKGLVNERLVAVVAPILAELGMELVEVAWIKEAGQQYLRVFIDKPEGILLDDCAAVSRALDAPLETLDLAAYCLEVSSPGAERPLKTDRDYERFQGRMVEVKTAEAIEGLRKFTGRLLGHDAETLRLEWQGRELGLPRPKITAARLTVVMPNPKDETEGGRPISI